MSNLLGVAKGAPYPRGRQLDEIDRTFVDRIKFDREKIASAGMTNRYLALR